MDCFGDYEISNNSTVNDSYTDYEVTESNYTVIDQAGRQWYKEVEYVIDNYVTHYICLFGIIGNLINFVVLTRKSLTAHMGKMEKASHVGLIALAVSDFLYCLCVFPSAFQSGEAFESPSIDFWLVYNTYSTACVNCFLLSSSWLTVSMAVCRYVAICHPLHARQYLGMTTSRAIICSVFVLSILFNIPRFWMKQISSYECVDGSRTYFHMPGYMVDNDTAKMTYLWLYFIVGILLPLVVNCNVYLVKAIQSSNKLRRQHSSGSSEATRIVTLTLCIIVIMYIILVGPAELIAFWRPFISSSSHLQFAVAVLVCNAIQTLNFAINFVLYCIINVHFRKVMKELILCQYFRSTYHREPSTSTTGHSKVVGDSTAMETTTML